MKTSRSRWQLKLGLALLALSTVTYVFHYAIFRDARHILIYLVGDIAFVFIEVLLVTIIIHEMLSQRERRQRLEKLNMVIGAFFSEVGVKLLKRFSAWDAGLEPMRSRLMITTGWTETDFDAVEAAFRVHSFRVEADRMDVAEMQTYLGSKVDFLLRLMENPNLLEHESFTDLLLAVFHLAEELVARDNPDALPASDRQHIAVDVERAYALLTHRWLDYMKYLRANYPYLFSLAVRTNPFDRTASPMFE